MLTITYNGYELDLTDASDLFWSLASTDLSNLSVREGGFNNTWQLNTSQQNREAFGFIDQPDSNLDAAYVFRPVNIYNDGCLVFTGLGRVTDVRLNKISLLVVDGVGGLSERLDALRASDVVLGTNSGSTISSTIGELIIYPLLDNALTKAFNFDNVRFMSAIASPWANLRELAILIINQCGYEVDIESPDALEVSTYVGGLYRFDDGEVLEDSTVSYEFAPNTTYIRSPGGPPLPNEQYWPASPPYRIINLFSNVTGGSRWRALAGGGDFKPPFLNRNVIVRCSYSISYDNGNFNTIISQRTYATSIMLELYSELRVINRVVFWVEPQGTVQGEFDFECLPGLDYTEFSLGIQWRLFTENDSWSMRITQGTITLAPVDVMADRISLRGICDMTPKEAVLEYMNRFGVIATVDDINKVVQFRKLQQLGNRTNPVDWRNKQFTATDLLGDGPYESTFVYGDLALRNLYTNESNIGNGVLATQITTGEQERVAYASALSVYGDEYNTVFQTFFVQANSQLWTNKLNNDLPVTYRLYDTGTTYSNGDLVRTSSPPDLFRRLNYTASSNVFPANNTTGTAIEWERISLRAIWDDFNGTSQIASFTSVAIPSSGIWSSFINYEFRGNGANSLTAPTLLFAPVYWQPLLNTYYLPLFTALNRPRVDKYLVKLNDSDIANIDFSRPVLINGSYYYVVLIDQYDIINQSPTPVVLLRLL